MFGSTGHADTVIRAVPTMDNETDPQVFFESAVTRMMDRLYGASMRFTRNAADAEDLMGET